MFTFHILIATIGRPSLQRLLDSLFPQLHQEDHVTIVFDGVEPIPLQLNHVCQVHIAKEVKSLGFWGHGIRNKYASQLQKTTFVMHADDDDAYTPDCFAKLRKSCTDADSLYIGQFCSASGDLIPKDQSIRLCNIGTPCGVIPYDLNMQATWQLKYGGDGLFYEALSKKTSKIVFLNYVLYNVRPKQTK